MGRSDATLVDAAPTIRYKLVAISGESIRKAEEIIPEPGESLAITGMRKAGCRHRPRVPARVPGHCRISRLPRVLIPRAAKNPAGASRANRKGSPAP